MRTARANKARLWASTVAMCLPWAAAAQNVTEVDVPQQALADAVVEFSQETGFQVSVPSDLVKGRQSQAVSGAMAPLDALKQIISRTDLHVRPVRENGAVVSRNEIVSQNEERPFDLGTIVLRGELIERDLQDSQTSAVVATGEQIDNRGETNLSQVINRTPGVNIDNTSVVIRGVNSQGVGVGAGNVASTITTSLDGIRVSDFEDISETDLSTWDLEQVEILRGAQSTQTGRNALFGAVVLESTDPQYTEEARLRFGAGNFESYQAALMANTVLIDDKLALRFSVDHRETAGFLNNLTGTNDRAAFTEVRTWRLGVRYDPTDRISSVFKYTFIEDRGASIRALTPALPARLSRSEDARQHDIHSLNAEFNFELSDTLTLTSNSLYTTADPRTQRVFVAGTSSRDRSYEVFEQEVRLSFESDRARAVIGGFYTRIDDDSVDTQTNPGSRLTAPPFPLSPNAVINSTVNELRLTENYALFGEIEYDIAPSWTLIAGARYDIEEFEADAFDQVVINDLGVTTPLPPIRDPNRSGTFEAFLPKLGVVHDFDADRSLGLTYQRGYRAGGSGINIGPVLIAQPPEVYDFDPEFTDTLELAWRSQFNDGRTTFNANLFYTDYKDIQVAVAGPLNPLDVTVQNVGGATLWGLEFDASTQITPDLALFANAAFTETEFGDFFLNNGAFIGGNRFPSSPNIAATIGAEYYFGNGWRVSGDASYTGTTFSAANNDPLFQNTDYLLLNGQISYAFNDQVSVTAYVRNLLDEEYTTTVAALSTFIGPPREFGFFLDASF